MDRRVLQEALANRRVVERVLRDLSDQVLEDFHRRGDQRARSDGYPMGVTDGGGGGPSILVTNEAGDLERVTLTGTESAALSRPQPDPVGRWLGELMALLDVLASTAKEIDGRRVSITKAHAELNQAAGAGVCEVCGRYCSGAENDRLKAGYCPADYTAWGRAGRPDRSVFRAERLRAS